MIVAPTSRDYKFLGCLILRFETECGCALPDRGTAACASNRYLRWGSRLAPVRQQACSRLGIHIEKSSGNLGWPDGDRIAFIDRERLGPGRHPQIDPHGDSDVPGNHQNGSGADSAQDLAWRTGGPQGSGIDTAANIFSRACGIAGLHVYGRREYYSNIMGRHSYYDVRVSDRGNTCHRETIDLLTTFESETLLRHGVAVGPGGGIIQSHGAADEPIDRIALLDQRAKEDLTRMLEDAGRPATTAGMLQRSREHGVHVFEVSYTTIIESLADSLGIPSAVAGRARNTIAVAVSCALLHFDRIYAQKAVEKQWPGRTKIIDMNVEAINQAYTYVAEELDLSGFELGLRPVETNKKRLFINGNQAVGLGKLAGGMTFQPYYPISPATDESTYLEAHEEFETRDGSEGSVLMVQTEDEIAAVTMAAGAALTGARSATATSGPGFSLMAEGIGWAGINEVPLVVTLWQRGGPSTGMPTRTEQGDLLFAINAGHGEFPRIVLSSSDVVEAFYDAAEAFNYAERYQTVIIHILDKALASTTRTVLPFDLDAIKIERGVIAELRGVDNGEPFKRLRDHGIRDLAEDAARTGGQRPLDDRRRAYRDRPRHRGCGGARADDGETRPQARAGGEGDPDRGQAADLRQSGRRIDHPELGIEQGRDPRGHRSARAGRHPGSSDPTALAVAFPEPRSARTIGWRGTTHHRRD